MYRLAGKFAGAGPLCVESAGQPILLLDSPRRITYNPPDSKACTGSILPAKKPFRQVRAQVAQLVEQRTENPRVGGSIPPLGTTISKT